MHLTLNISLFPSSLLLSPSPLPSPSRWLAVGVIVILLLPPLPPLPHPPPHALVFLSLSPSSSLSPSRKPMASSFSHRNNYGHTVISPGELIVKRFDETMKHWWVLAEVIYLRVHQSVLCTMASRIFQDPR